MAEAEKTVADYAREKILYISIMSQQTLLYVCLEVSKNLECWWLLLSVSCYMYAAEERFPCLWNGWVPARVWELRQDRQSYSPVWLTP